MSTGLRLGLAAADHNVAGRKSTTRITVSSQRQEAGADAQSVTDRSCLWVVCTYLCMKVMHSTTTPMHGPQRHAHVHIVTRTNSNLNMIS